MNFFKIFILTLSFSFCAYGENKLPINWSGNIYKVVHSFNVEFNKFSKKVCRPGEEKKYWDLLKNYRGQGYYLPKLGDDIDRKAIKKNIGHFQKKLVYIKGLSEKLEKVSYYPQFEFIYNELEKIVNHLLNLKKLYRTEIRIQKKGKIKKESRRHILLFKKQFNVFMNHLFFMQSYHFPNDYLKYRTEFEKNKYELEDIKKANETFFFRKIVEDGAMDPDRHHSDKFTRTSLDTLYLNIQKEKDFISEKVRYDLDWISGSLRRILKRGKKVQLSRLNEWYERTKSSYEFYKEIIKTTNKKKAKEMVRIENESSIKLKEFVYGKQAEVYEYWTNKSELFKALYSLETILINEVGVIDGPYALERMSVARVVMNRFFDDFYNQLDKKQMLYELIDKDIDKDDEHWLNVLFRIGEFSFTYHYISAVSKIFCPDMSSRGKSIRSKNLKIILKSIKQYDDSFSAFRYFSRVSMLGKIDMSSVWTNYVRLPEMVGFESKNQRRLLRYFLADKYQYLYSFQDRKNVEYTVLKIDGRTYSMRWKKGKPIFFDYRNPHLFAYFSKKK